MTAVLQTPRLTLTPASVADFEDLCALWSDETFARAVLPGRLAREDVWTRLLRDIGHWTAFGHGNWMVRLREDQTFVGTVGVFDFRRDLEPSLDARELGWGVAPAHQNQGLGREALTAALAWCDHVLRAARTVCIIDPENAPSHALAARVGFRPYAQVAYRARRIVLLERSSAVEEPRDAR